MSRCAKTGAVEPLVLIAVPVRRSLRRTALVGGLLLAPCLTFFIVVSRRASRRAVRLPVSKRWHRRLRAIAALEIASAAAIAAGIVLLLSDVAPRSSPGLVLGGLSAVAAATLVRAAIEPSAMIDRDGSVVLARVHPEFARALRQPISLRQGTIRM